MAVTAVKTWVAGEILTASDLNSEFSNILTGGQNIGHPRTIEFRMDGKELKLDANEDTSITADTDDQIDIRVGGTDIVAIYNVAPWMTINGTPVATTSQQGLFLARLGTAEAQIVDLNSNAAFSQLDNF